jgi:hypothetical protein
MKQIIIVIAALTLVACSTGGSTTNPPITTSTADPSVLRFAVGTVNFAGAGLGINVLETFRNAGGYSAVPLNSAALSGPSGFSGPAGSLDPGAGAATVPLGSINNDFIVGTVPGSNTTILASADGFGIGPPSSSAAGQNFYPAQPQFADVTPGGQALFPPAPHSQSPSGAIPIYGGQPAYPAAPLVASALSSQLLIPSAWPEGFYLLGLNAAPPSGTYTLNVSYVQNGQNANASATASLNNQTVLQPFELSTNSTGNGGATVTLIGPYDPRIVEIIVNVIDANVPPSPGATCLTGAAFATVVFKAAGTQVIPPNLGQGGSKTFCTGDLLATYGFGFDYDQYGLGPPGNTSQTPTLPAQADVSITPALPTNE